MWQSLHDAWWRLATQNQPRSFADVLASCVLSVASLVYRAGLAVRDALYDLGWVRSAKLPCPVVSIGNLTVGGTGKTACVELIVKKLSVLGKNPAVLSRGYGGKKIAYRLSWEAGSLLVNGKRQESISSIADEPQLLAEHLKGVQVFVGERRDVNGFEACAKFHAKSVVLDDGFQNRLLKKDCEIVLIHARMPLGGWAILPRGPMREPLSSLARAHVVIITKADEALSTLGAMKEKLRSLCPSAILLSAVHEPALILDVISNEKFAPERLNGMRVGMLSSIGDPKGFEATLERLHASIMWHVSFPDHYQYREKDCALIVERLNAQRPDALITTEKDWARLKAFAGKLSLERVALWILCVRMRIIEGEDELDSRLAGLFAR